jgi:hypothetical protein
MTLVIISVYGGFNNNNNNLLCCVATEQEIIPDGLVYIHTKKKQPIKAANNRSVDINSQLLPGRRSELSKLAY